MGVKRESLSKVVTCILPHDQHPQQISHRQQCLQVSEAKTITMLKKQIIALFTGMIETSNLC